VWKTIVANTPKTLREIMPVLMDTLIASLASASSERRQVCTYIYIYISTYVQSQLLGIICP
jgi:hypothetical protein